MRIDPKELNACPPLLNQKQLCRVCHISPRTAHYLLQSGAIPNERGSQYQIRREDVLAFMQSSEKLLIPAPVRTSVGKWLRRGRMRYILLDRAYHIPKTWAIDYLCSEVHNDTHRKSPQHMAALWAVYEEGVTA